jgi:hypothetical protein
MLCHRLALRRCRNLLGYASDGRPIEQVIGRPPTRPPEDAVRQSDGYCRVCHPIFRHANPRLAGETGYLSWLGGDEDKLIDDECVAFRCTTLADTGLSEALDPRGRALADLLKELLPDLALGAMRPLREAFHRAWSVKRLQQGEATPLAKGPWDHPFLLVVPRDWHRQVIFPHGSGIHDKDGYPCHAPKVLIHITLKEELVDAVDRLSARGDGRVADKLFFLDDAYMEEWVAHPPTSSSVLKDRLQIGAPMDADVKLCRKLLYNAWRILPGVYESLLTSLVRCFRTESVALFAEHHSDTATAKDELLERLNAEWANQLPEPLGELVQMSVLDLDVDCTFGGDVRDRLFKLRQLQKEELFIRKRHVDILREQIEELMLRGDVMLGDDMDTAEQDAIRRKLSVDITDAENEALRQANNAVDDLCSFREKERFLNRPNVFARLAKKLSESRETFHHEVTGTVLDLQKELEKIREATASLRGEDSGSDCGVPR